MTDDVTFSGSFEEKIFIAEIESSLANPPTYVDFGKLINGQILYIDKLKEVEDDVLMFHGFFRGERIEIYNGSIEGNPDNLNSFFGIVDLKSKECSLFNFSNTDESTFRSKIRLSSDKEYIYALGRFRPGNVLINDTIIMINSNEPQNLVLTKIKLSDTEKQQIIRFPSCNQAVGIHVDENSIIMAGKLH